MPHIIPVVTTSGDIFKTLTTYVFIPTALMTVFLFSALVMLNNMEDDYRFRNKKLWLLFVALAGLAVIVAYGTALETVKGFLLCLILLYASIADIDRHEVPDFIPVMIILTAFIGFDVSSLGSMLIGAAVVFVPQLAVVILKPNRYGGADIKISTAIAFLLGAEKGLFAIILGLVIAVIAMILHTRARKLPKSTPFPIVPFLAIGGMLAYII